MKEIQTKSGKILCVEVPEDVNWVEISANNLGGFINTTLDLKDVNYFLQYGKGKYGFPPNRSVYYNLETFYCLNCLKGIKQPKLLGLLKDLTDSDVDRFVEYKKVKGQYEDCYYFKSYNNVNNFTYGNPKQSFISLLQSEGIDTDRNLIIIEKL